MNPLDHILAMQVGVVTHDSGHMSGVSQTVSYDGGHVPGVSVSQSLMVVTVSLS